MRQWFVGVLHQKLQMRLGEMELELHAAKEEALRQERNVQNLSDTVISKETEVSRIERMRRSRYLP